MRETSVRSIIASVVGRLRGSAWTPLLLKGVGFAVLLIALGALGSGALDRWTRASPAFGAVHRAGDADRPSGRMHARASAVATGEPMQAGPVPSSSGVAPHPVTSAAGTGSSSAHTSDGRVILNLAVESDLVGLPGIGPKKAKAIIELRAKLGGRFKRLEELTRIRGIKRKFLDRLRPRVLLDPP
jgi:competence protein ComEA